MENLSVYLSALLPSVIILALACAVLLLTAFFKQKANNFIYYITQIGLLVCLAFLLKQYADTTQAIAIAHDRFRIDKFSLFGSIFIVALSFFALFCAREELGRLKCVIGEYFALCLFSLVGMLVMTTAYHFLTLFIALELMTFPLYILCAYQRNSTAGSEAAIKYFVTGVLASGLLLYGISLIYGVVHALGFVDIGIAVNQLLSHNDSMMLLVGVAFVLAALAFKLGLAPFHMWVPDVYEGAPSAVTLFIATAPKIAVVILLLRVLQSAFVALSPYLNEMLYAIAVLSLVVSNVFALTQRHLRRMFAYSSIAQMGFVLLGVATNQVNILGFSSALFYTISYAVVSAGGFAMITLLNCQGKTIQTIDDLAGLNRKHPWLAFMMLLLVVSMAGVPPTVGFIAKLSVLMALLQAGQIALAVFAVLMSVVGLYYYLRVIKVMYFNDEKEAGLVEASTISTSSVVMMSITGLFALLLGVFPAALLSYCQTVLL